MGACCKAAPKRADPVPPAEPQAYSHPTAKLALSLGVHRETVKLTLDQDCPTRACLEFAYSAQYDCEVTAHWAVREVASTGFKKVEFEKQAGAPRSITYLVSQGSKKAFPAATIFVNLQTIAEGVYDNKTTYPLVLEMAAHEFQTQLQVQWTYLSFSQEAGVWTAKVTQQKVQVGEHLVEALEVFGGESEENCVVCIAQARSVLVLPCRHLCLCANCAKDFTQQSVRKCPICRTDVENLVKVR